MKRSTRCVGRRVAAPGLMLKLVGDGHAYVRLSAVYRLSSQFPDYPDAQPLHDALVDANPERLMWGTDGPHPSIPAEVMTTAICLICFTSGPRTNKSAAVFWWIPRHGCSGGDPSHFR